MFPNIEAERARAGLSKEQVSKLLGVSSKTYSNWMKGKTDIPASALTCMVKMWHTSADYLLGLDKHKNAS